MKFEIEILKGIVHKQEQQIKDLKNTVVELVARQMADNLMISGLIDTDFVNNTSDKEGDNEQYPTEEETVEKSIGPTVENCVKTVKNFLRKYMQLEAADQDIYDAYRMGDQQEGKTKVMFIKCHPKLRQKILSKTKLLKGKHNSKGQAFFVNQQVLEMIAAEKCEMSYAIKKVRDNNSGKTPDQRSKYRIKNRILYIDDNPQMKPVHWRIHGGVPGMRAPLGVQILSFSCSFWQKIEK